MKAKNVEPPTALFLRIPLREHTQTHTHTIYMNIFFV